MLIVVCYDVADDQRRARVSNELENFGTRVQYSVFECYLDESELQELSERLAGIIQEQEDRLGYYLLCPKDAQDMFAEGRYVSSRDPDYHVI